VSQQASTRTYQGVELPPVGTYKLDKAHTRVGFVARHMLSKVRGRFTEFDGTVVIGDTPQESSVEVEVQTASITTDTEMRDNHLRSGDFFLAEEHPVLTFKSKEIRPGEGNSFQIVGDLTIKGITREVVLDAEYEGWGPSPDGTAMLVISATTEINREDWGITWNVAVETGGFLVGKKVVLDIESEALLQE